MDCECTSHIMWSLEECTYIGTKEPFGIEPESIVQQRSLKSLDQNKVLKKHTMPTYTLKDIQEGRRSHKYALFFLCIDTRCTNNVIFQLFSALSRKPWSPLAFPSFLPQARIWDLRTTSCSRAWWWRRQFLCFLSPWLPLL